jgi:hypothetical protein
LGEGQYVPIESANLPTSISLPLLEKKNEIITIDPDPDIYAVKYDFTAHRVNLEGIA